MISYQGVRVSFKMSHDKADTAHVRHTAGSTLNTNKTCGQGSAEPQQDNVGPLATHSRALHYSANLLPTHDGQLQCRAAQQPGVALRIHATW
jgi:hypothetical protein